MASTAHGLHDDVTAHAGLAYAALPLARHLSRGATLWCVSPQWPEHARHVAVEFVHPVIIGKPALAAVAIDAADPASALRPLVQIDDVLMVIGEASDEPAALCTRAAAWGALSIWLGAGPRPARLSADHLLWLDDDPRVAAHDGRLVWLYHVLWELTHVCLEHSGLLTIDAPACDVDETCITCSDEGRVAEVVGSSGCTATVRTARGVETVDVTVVEPVVAGDLLLVHAGTAITRLDS